MRTDTHTQVLTAHASSMFLFVVHVGADLSVSL